MTYDEVRTQLRLHGIDDIDKVSRAFLEPNGMVSIVARDGVATAEAPEPPTR